MDTCSMTMQLNAEQKQAVEAIYGPVLVVAGPGTGKTQLLSERIVNILAKTDASSSNILCLTFTEAGARAMRQRLLGLIGKEAAGITINTYHEFAKDLIGGYPEYFEQYHLEEVINDLEKHRLIQAVLDNLPLGDINKNYQPRSGSEAYLGIISDFKNHLLTPDDVRKIAEQNLADAELIEQAFVDLPPKISKGAIPVFAEALEKLQKLQKNSQISTSNRNYETLTAILIRTLAEALEEIEISGKTTALTNWKKRYLKRNDHNKAVLQSTVISRRLLSLAGIYADYQDLMQQKGLYDFDDMILRAIQVVEANQDLKYTLQERFQFILLDEYQDTNPDQAKLVRLLTTLDNGDTPNVLAVGDDDQAIMAFQGADAHNLLDFRDFYQDTTQINLRMNYRSGDEILQLADQVITQVPDDDRAKAAEDKLVANKKDAAKIEFKQFDKPILEYYWVAEQVAELKQQDPNASVAVIAPKHQFLVDFMPYLLAKKLPVEYEKRENILESQEIMEISAAAELIQALYDGDPTDHLWLGVLGIPRLGLPPRTLLKIASQTKSERIAWQDYFLDHLEEFDDPKLRAVIEKIWAWAASLANQTAKAVLSELIHFLYRPNLADTDNPELQNVLSHLTTIWNNIVERQAQSDFSLGDFLDYIKESRAAELRVINKNPIRSNGDAVQVMSAHSAKGLEFDHVFLLNCSEAGWNSQRNNNAGFPRPKNLGSITRANQNEFGKLRLFFVAITRAKTHLVMTYGEGEPLSFLEGVLTPEKVEIGESHLEKQMTEGLLHKWIKNAEQSPDFNLAMEERLQQFKLSPSTFIHFLDLEHNGPEAVQADLMFHISKPIPTKVELGKIVHFILEKYLPGRNLGESVRHFIKTKTNLSSAKWEEYQNHAMTQALDYIKAYPDLFKGTQEDREKPISAVWEGIPLYGKIDNLIKDEASKTIHVLDFKTGVPHTRFKAQNSALYGHRWQLYFYKLLLENDLRRRFKGYQIVSGSLNFTDRDPESGLILPPLNFDFNTEDETRFRQLLQVVYARIKNLDFSIPSDDELPKAANKMMSFEEFLLGK